MPTSSTRNGGRRAAAGWRRAAWRISSPMPQCAVFPTTRLERRNTSVPRHNQEHYMSDPIVLVSVVRTPMGGMMGSLSDLAAHQLGAVAIKAAIERAGIQPDTVDEVIMGNVL